MKITKETTETITKDESFEIEDKTYYFSDFDADKFEYRFRKITILKNGKFKTLYDIKTETVVNYCDDYSLTCKEYCETDLPYHLREYFPHKKEITEEQFNKEKQEILNRLTNK